MRYIVHVRTACLVFLCTLLLGANCNSSAAADGEPTTVLLGSATQGGGFQPSGQSLAEAAAKKKTPM